MKMMPRNEKMDVTLSVTAMALIWPGVASAAMMIDLVVSTGAHQGVNAGPATQRLGESIWCIDYKSERVGCGQ